MTHKIPFVIFKRSTLNFGRRPIDEGIRKGALFTMPLSKVIVVRFVHNVQKQDLSRTGAVTENLSVCFIITGFHNTFVARALNDIFSKACLNFMTLLEMAGKTCHKLTVLVLNCGYQIGFYLILEASCHLKAF